MNNMEDYNDIDAVVEAIREAWKCVPTFSLGRMLDEATSAPFYDLTSDELVAELNEFILQNQ